MKERNIYAGFYYHQSSIKHLILTSESNNIESALPYEPLRFLYTMNDLIDVDELLAKYNKSLTLYVGSESDKDINTHLKNIKIITWDSVDFFSKLNIFTMPTRFGLEKDIEYYKNQKEIPPTKLLTSLTHTKPGRMWRSYIINQFYKHKLIEHGSFPQRYHPKLIPSDFNNLHFYNFPDFIFGDRDREEFILDYWNPKQIKLKSDEYYASTDDCQLMCPNEYMICSFDAVVETLYEDFFVTEKTIRALDAKKPFFVFACPKFHLKLKEDYGFKLYDEIIDYTFDNVPHTRERFDLLINEMNKLAAKYTPQQIFDITKEKVDFNYNRLNELRKHKITNIPDHHYVEHPHYDNDIDKKLGKISLI